METLYKALIFVPPLFFAVILHEVAHGWAAEKLGDPTARLKGRITLNPIVHIDLFTTIILPALLIFSGSPIVFGMAKPVPVNPLNLRNPRRDMAYVALAGPITNFILALVFSGVFFLMKDAGAGVLTTYAGGVAVLWTIHSVLINLVLGIFNLLPVPPLDGGRIAVGFLPLSLATPLARLERYGILIVVALLYFGIVDQVLGPVMELAQRLLLGL